MFKENKEFWAYVVGIVFLMFMVYFVVAGYRFPFAGFLFDYGDEDYDYENAPAYDLDEGVDYRARLYTNLGVVDIDLYEQNAPDTVNNFVFLSDAGYYDGVSFHRVIRDFLVQTGSRTSMDDDLDNDGIGDPGYVFDDEVNWNSLDLSSEQIADLQADGFSNDLDVTSRRLEKYSVAMANAGPDTNGSQFFIVLSNSDDLRLDVLQGRHTVFGNITAGFEVLAKINQAELDRAEDDSISRPIGEYLIQRVEIYTK